jgi:hypothetical protein
MWRGIRITGCPNALFGQPDFIIICGIGENNSTYFGTAPHDLPGAVLTVWIN